MTGLAYPGPSGGSKTELVKVDHGSASEALASTHVLCLRAKVAEDDTGRKKVQERNEQRQINAISYLDAWGEKLGSFDSDSRGFCSIT